MMNRYETTGYGRSDYGGGGGDFGLFSSYSSSAVGPPAVPSPFGPPPPSLMSLSAVPPLIPPSGPAPLSLQSQQSLPPPTVLPPSSHLHPGPGLGVGPGAGSAGMTTAGVNTNSKHPLAVKARVFVGNLNTNAVSREEFEQLFRRFGEVLAVSMHRGYGFIQYASEYEARNAISFTDGMLLGGQRLDVNLASEPKTGREPKAIKRQADTNVSDASSKRSRPSDGKGTAATPKPLFPAGRSTNVELTKGGGGTVTKTTPTKSATIVSNKSANIAVVPKKTEPTTTKAQTGTATAATAKTAAVAKADVNGDLGTKPCVPAPGATQSSPDILICGQCRSLFNNIAAFTAHRKEGQKCTIPATDKATAAKTGKAEGEPDDLLCFLCQKPFDNAWLLLDHIGKGHGISVYHTSKTAGDDAGTSQAAKEKILAGAAAIATAKAGLKKENDEEGGNKTD